MSRTLFIFDICLVSLTAIALLLSLGSSTALVHSTLALLAFLGLVPVAISAFKSLLRRELSVDLLASIALIFSLLSREWKSAALITLMLGFARIFESITEERVKNVMKSLMKYRVEQVRILDGETIREAHIDDIRPGDLVIVESGESMPVDGTVVSGDADVNESSLTGESDLVPKKAGDKVFTATINESGSMVVRTEKVGADTTLSRIIRLVEESGQQKNKAERMADRFTQWYIGISVVAAAAMYFAGMSTREILAILLVVCADDIAVAVPLAFTAATARAAKRGIVVRGSAAFEQLSKLRYILTDKTGTLTTGKPRVIDIRTYGAFTRHKVLELCLMGSSESSHAVSRAIADYATREGVRVHAPHELEEVPGKGVRFRHTLDRMLLGRLAFLESMRVHVTDVVRRDIDMEKDAGRGVAVLAVNGHVAGVVSYHDSLRPRMSEYIGETVRYGVKEWHMLTGDNEHAAAAVARELGIKQFHANMTPESKVSFVHRFERAHEPEVVGYIGDGVNDAASLALADVSIAMGGIGADAAMEAADVTIMKDRMSRLPEALAMSHKVMNILWQNFGIWIITNVIGLGLVLSGVIGPVGAAAYNFLTDFIPIGNALRAGRGKNA